MTRQVTAATLATLLFLLHAGAYAQVSEAVKSQTTESAPVDATKDPKRTVPAAAVQRSAEPVAPDSAAQHAPQPAVQSNAVRQPVQGAVQDNAVRQPAAPPPA